MGGHRSVKTLLGLQTVVTAVAGHWKVGFPKVGEEHVAAAAPGFRVVDHLLELFARDALLLGVAFLLDEGLLFDDVRRAVEQDALARQSVAAGASRLLVVALDVLGQVVVHDKPHVGFVHPHPEGDRGAHDPGAVPQEVVLAFLALLGFQSRVVGLGGYSGRAQPFREGLGGLATLAVDNAGFLWSRLDPLDDLVGGFAFGQDPVAKIRAVEAGGVAARFAQFEQADDVLAHTEGGRRCQGDEGHAGEGLAQAGQLAVLGPEIVAPFADTVGLVYGNEPHSELGEAFNKTGKHHALRGEVEQFVLPAVQPPEAGLGLFRGKCGI